jgi:hypothetical protein
MRYVLAVMAFFGLAFAACNKNAEVTCDVDSVIAHSGDTYYSIARDHCSNPAEAESLLMDINKYPAGMIPLGATIILP